MEKALRISAKALMLATDAALGTGTALADKPSSAGNGKDKDRQQTEQRYDQGDNASRGGGVRTSV